MDNNPNCFVINNNEHVHIISDISQMIDNPRLSIMTVSEM
jgi:hypothetical protein